MRTSLNWRSVFYSQHSVYERIVIKACIQNLKKWHVDYIKIETGVDREILILKTTGHDILTSYIKEL